MAKFACLPWKFLAISSGTQELLAIASEMPWCTPIIGVHLLGSSPKSLALSKGIGVEVWM